MKTITLVIFLLCVPVQTIMSDSPHVLTGTNDIIVDKPIPTDSNEPVESTSQKIENEIRATLNELNVEPFVIELLVAQSKYESGNYTNNLSKYNNVFSRHYSRKADVYAISGGARAEGHNGFAKYASVRDATLSQYEYLHRKKYSFKWESAWQFAYELKKKNYYTAPLNKYANGINVFLNQQLKKV